MPAPDDTHDPHHPPSVDDHAQQKRDLWAAAKAAALARGGHAAPASPAPAPEQPPPPPKKRKIKLRAPPIVERAPSELFATEESDAASPPSNEHEASAPDDHEAPVVVEEPLPTASKEILGFTTTDEDRETRLIASPATKREKPPGDESDKKAEVDDKPSSKEPKTDSKDQPADDKKSEAKKKSDDKEAIPLTDEEQRAAKWKARRAKVLKLWLIIGGGSLGVSLGVHLLLLIIATLLYVTYNREERIDFLPGGGTKQGADASQALENKVTRKKNQWLTKKVPLQKVAVQNAMSQIQLPDQDLDIQLPMTKDFMTAGKMAGGGLGGGTGLGAKGGMAFKPITLFGREIIGKKLAVILDVSYSMTPYLSAVVKEVDRVAKGSPVILYYGCGLERVKPGVKLNENVYRTQQMRAFEVYWRLLRDDPSKPAKQIPNSDVFQSFARRDNTFYVDNHEVEYSWTALLNDVIRSADALYWFSDFDDPVNERQMAIVKENLDNRKQRLYIHPQKRGFSFEKVRDVLAIPTGGDVIEPKEK